MRNIFKTNFKETHERNVRYMLFLFTKKHRLLDQAIRKILRNTEPDRSAKGFFDLLLARFSKTDVGVEGEEMGG